VWMVKGSAEGMSGGPFYRSLINQGDGAPGDQEIYEMINYGEAQTEAFRTGVLTPYTLVFTSGGTPSTPDLSWQSGLGLTGYVAASGRGAVAGVGIAGRDTAYQYVVGFANSKAQYWTTATSSGSYSCSGMLPGTYNQTIYKGELAVWTGSVTVTAGATKALNTITITGDPSATATIWRIGNWDGTPSEFLNGVNMTTMHPQDVRMSSWGPKTYTVGSSSPATGFPAVQFRLANSPTTVKFTLTAAQAAAAHNLKIGITCAYIGGRPSVVVNGHALTNPGASSQPSTRSVTIGTYRENNTTFTYSIPAADFVTGANTLTITPISGTTDLGTWLSAAWAYDCVELDN